MPHLERGVNATMSTSVAESVIETPSSLPIMADHSDPRKTEHLQKSEQMTPNHVNLSHMNLTLPSLASNEVFTTTVRPTIIIYPTGTYSAMLQKLSKCEVRAHNSIIDLPLNFA